VDVGGQHVSSLLVNPNVKLPAESSADELLLPHCCNSYQPQSSCAAPK